MVLIGQLIVIVGVQNYSIHTMLAGRVILGIGAESMGIPQNAMIVKWFFKKEIALPFGLCISICRIGNVINDVFSPRISNVYIFIINRK